MSVRAIKLPDVGEGVTEAELVEWHVEVGDAVHEDDVIAVVMTDKATVEIPSLYDGTVVERAGEIGEFVAIGANLVVVDSGESGPAHDSASPEPVSRPSSPEEPVTTQLGPSARRHAGAPRAEGSPVLASPSVRARAKQAGIDLTYVAGTGPAGRVVHADLDDIFAGSAGVAVAPAQPLGSHHAVTTGLNRAGPETEEIKIVGLRRKISERMSLANARIPHITVVEEIDMTALEELREKLNADRGDRPKLTLLPFLSAALCRAVVDHPEMNAHFDDDAGVIKRHSSVHLGIATMTDQGLVVPVVRHAERHGLFAAAGEIARLSQAARDGTARADELSGSTLTITSLGPLGAVATTPIINHPEVAIVGINKMAVRPWWDGNQFVPRKMMNISASFDHRVIDGWDAAVFVQRVKSLLETPALIFVEG